MYPIRVRFPNVITGKSGWITVGYIPAMKYRKGATDAEKAKVRVLRDELLQRCLAVVIDTLITASAVGFKLTLQEHGAVWAVPRIVLYACDQPEERHLLGMKLSGCYFPCSVCMEFKSHVAVPSMGACKRDVLATLEDQMEATELAEKGERPSRVEQLAKQSSITPVVPVLGAVHGLGTGSLSLFRIFGFDRLHVCFSHALSPRVQVACSRTRHVAFCSTNRMAQRVGQLLTDAVCFRWTWLWSWRTFFVLPLCMGHLKVMKLGVLKVIADKIPALLFELCGQGDARRGPKDETLVAVNERIGHMGRLILATLAPPGYVDCCAPGAVWAVCRSVLVCLALP